jgi:hypothetical protein
VAAVKKHVQASRSKSDHEHGRRVSCGVTSDGKVLATGTVDQSVGPQGPRFESAVWQEIGIIHHTGGPATIEATTSPDVQGHVVADGIWLRPVEQ